MKEQLKKRVQKICDDVGTQAAAEKADELAEGVCREYDKRIASGMAELDVYREMLRDLDKIEELVQSLPETEAEAEGKQKRLSQNAWKKKLSAIQGRINGLWWLLTVIFYFWFSFTFGNWHLTWLMFLSSAIGSIVIGMVFDFNRGVPKKKIYKKLHGILWIAVVIAYFLISFTFGKWHLTWLIFIMGAVIDMIMDLVGKIKD